MKFWISYCLDPECMYLCSGNLFFVFLLHMAAAGTIEFKPLLRDAKLCLPKKLKFFSYLLDFMQTALHLCHTAVSRGGEGSLPLVEKKRDRPSKLGDVCWVM